MEIVFLLFVLISLIGWVIIYRFFKSAKPIDAHRLNNIEFGRTTDYTLPVEDDRSKELIIEVPKDHRFDDWHKG